MEYQINSQSVNDYLETTKEALSNLIVGKKVKTKLGQNYEIEEVSKMAYSESDAGKSDAVVKLKDGPSYYLFTAIDNKFLMPEAEALPEINKIAAEYRKNLDEYITKLKSDALQALVDTRNAEKEAEKQKALHKKAESMKVSLLAKTSNLSNSDSISVGNEFAVSVGYLAKHAKKVYAQMPDYLDHWFTGEFGDVEHKLIDSTKTTSNGSLMQWTLSLKIDLDTNENLPNYLRKYLSNTKHEIQSISNTDFVFKLARDYGFTFGKKQDLDKIKSCVPVEYLQDFEAGYQM